MSALTAREVAVVRQVAGLVLQYPDDALRRDLPILRTAVGGLPAPSAARWPGCWTTSRVPPTTSSSPTSSQRST